MDKRCGSCGDVNNLNKLSHKISKPSFKTPSDHNFNFLPPHHHPPVYTINKIDFRDVVHKLTGFSPPPPPQPHSSRLHRIRPPPLLTCAAPNPSFSSFGRSAAPLSPLPPLPSVHAAAESPVSAYMRFLHNPNPNHFSGLLSPAPPPPPPQFHLPSSPLPFGCFNSPKSPHPLLSPGVSGWRDV